MLAVDARDRAVERVGDPDRPAAGDHCAGPPADEVLRRDAAAVRVDQPDVVLVDARKPVGLEHAADAEGGRAGEQQNGRGRDQDARAPVRWRPRRRWPGLSGRRSRGAVERRVLGEDRLVQPPQLGAGLDADLLDQHCARVAVGLERLRLAPAAVQREHALGVQPLAQRVLGDERVELADHLGVPAGVEVRVDRQLGRAQPQLVEPADLGGRERLVGDVGQRLAAPQRERLPGAPVVEQPLEPRRVDVAVGQPQLVAAPVGDDLRAVAVEQPAQVRHVELHHLRRAGGGAPPTALPRADRPRPCGRAAARASPAPRAASGRPARRGGRRGVPRPALGGGDPRCGAGSVHGETDPTPRR